MSSAQKSEEVELDYDHVSKNNKTYQVENLGDFFLRYSNVRFINFDRILLSIYKYFCMVKICEMLEEK